MSWCKDNGVDYALWRVMNEIVRKDFRETVDIAATMRAVEGPEAVRGFVENGYAASSQSRERRVIAHIEAPGQGLDVRTTVTSLATGAPEAL